MDLTSPISGLTRVGRAAEARLKKLGILTVRDLLLYFPFRYEDLSVTVPIRGLVPGRTATVRAVVEQIRNRRSRRGGKILTEAIVADGSGKMKAVWFNQPYVVRALGQGTEVFLSGKVDGGLWGTSILSPVWEPVRDEQIHTGRIVPMYSATADLTPRQIRFLVRQAMPLARDLPDPIPEEMRRAHRLEPEGGAIAALHFPSSWNDVDRARRRISWERLFILALRNLRARARLAGTAAPAVPFDEEETKRFVSSLPFRLTDGQRRAAWRVIRDMGESHPMNRLLNGDVGSGKTLIAALAALNAARAGFQTAVLVPTEILARQHFRTLCRLLIGSGVRVALLVRSAAETSDGPVPAGDLRELVAGGGVDIVVGTHALLEETVVFGNLALAVIDEQHRFGVDQRRRLREKMTKGSKGVEKGAPRRGSGQGEGAMPHLLSMTATPIPRTLALTLYGDLDLSVLDELPPGRTPVVTKLLPPGDLRDSEAEIRETVRAGRQAFVICPQIDERDRGGARAATAEHRRLSESLSGISVALLHGRLPAAERERVMASFVSGGTSVLVSTSVVEVGVDVPNATLIVIEDAERFGLAQLHQFRGRVGRGACPSSCLLVPGAECGEEGLERLEIVAAARDGFALAERDLELRGPGDIFGTAQSGRAAGDSLIRITPALIEETQEAARSFLARDPELASAPLLREELSRIGEETHLE